MLKRRGGRSLYRKAYNVGVDCAILMNPQTWVASGHLGGFSDPLMDCKDCMKDSELISLLKTGQMRIIMILAVQ